MIPPLGSFTIILLHGITKQNSEPRMDRNFDVEGVKFIPLVQVAQMLDSLRVARSSLVLGTEFPLFAEYNRTHLFLAQSPRHQK